MNNLILSFEVQRAVVFAGQAHGTQLRKGTDIPYITHPLTVAMLLVAYDFPEDIVVAGILHDVLEDTSITRQQMTIEFSPLITSWVVAVSESEKKLPWRDRKRKAIAKVSEMEFAPLVIKAADAISNMTDILVGYDEDGDEYFDNFKAGKDSTITRYASLVQAINERKNSSYDIKTRLTDIQRALFVELDATLAALLKCF